MANQIFQEKDEIFSDISENRGDIYNYILLNPGTYLRKIFKDVAYTVLLNGIHYNIFVNNQTVSSGDIGGESLIDIMTEVPEFPVISNDTVTPKNVQTTHTNEIKNDISNVMTAGKACFTVNGTYFYRQSANLTASGGGNEFQLKFPGGCR